MATNIKTVMTYPLNGSTTDFNIPFEYLARKFVQVTLIGVDRKVLVLNPDYRFATKALISTTRAWGPADGYQQIEIRRYTSATERLVDFTDGSILRAYDLNISQIQTLHVAEEARDLTADTIGVNNDGNLDARGRRIVNVADPIGDGDAVSLRSLKVWNESALNSANKAKDSSEEAKRQSDLAGRMRNETEVLRNDANQHRVVAESAKDQSITAKKQAEAARDLASGSRNAASGFSEESKQYMEWSKKWAVNPVGVAVQDGEFSAKHWQHYSKVEADRSKNEADRAKSEADKIQDYNNLGPEVNRINASVIELNSKTTNMDCEAGYATSFSGTSERPQMGLRVGSSWLGFKYNPVVNALFLESWKTEGGTRLPTLGASFSEFPGYVKSPATHITGGTNNTNIQGLHLAWNVTGQPEPGYAVISNNKGGGNNGGFVFRCLDAAGAYANRKWTFDGGSGGLYIEGPSPVLQVKNVNTGTAANFSEDGNLYGGRWTKHGGSGFLSDYLTSGRAVASCAGLYPRLRMWDGIGDGYLSFMIDSTSCGIRWFVSDERHKENIQAIEDAEEITNIIREYKAVSYKFRDWSMGGKASRFGYTAQDLQKMWPESVSVMENTEDAIGETTLLPDHNELIGGIMLMLKSLDARLQRIESRMSQDGSPRVELRAAKTSSKRSSLYSIVPADLSEGFEEYDSDGIEDKLEKSSKTFNIREKRSSN